MAGPRRAALGHPWPLLRALPVQGQPLGPQGPVWVPALHAGPQAPPLAAPLGLYRWQSSPWQLPRSAPPAPRLLAPSPPRTIPSSHPHMRLHGGSFGGSQRTAGTGDRSDPPAPDASFSPAASLGRSSLSPPQPRLHGASDQRGAGQAAGGGVSGSAPGDSVLQRQRAHLAQLKQQRQQLGVAGRQQQVMSQLMAGAGPPPPQQQQQYQQQGQQQQRAGLLSVQLQQGSADGGGGGAAAPAPEPQSPHLVGQQQPQPVMSRGVSNERRIRGASFAAAALGLPSPALSPLLEGLAGGWAKQGSPNPAMRRPTLRLMHHYLDPTHAPLSQALWHVHTPSHLPTSCHHVPPSPHCNAQAASATSPPWAAPWASHPAGCAPPAAAPTCTAPARRPTHRAVRSAAEAAAAAA